MANVKVNDSVVVDGQQWNVQSLGVIRDDGTVYAHLASTTVKLKQKNGMVPQQIATFIPLEAAA